MAGAHCGSDVQQKNVAQGDTRIVRKTRGMSSCPCQTSSSRQRRCKHIEHRAIVVLNSTSHHLNLIVKLTPGSGEGVGRSQETPEDMDRCRSLTSQTLRRTTSVLEMQFIPIILINNPSMKRHTIIDHQRLEEALPW
jgi:hypothetical protein